MESKDNIFSVKFSLNLKGNLIDVSTPIVMGILNITTDSFYAGSRYKEEKTIVSKAEQFLKQGAAILDIGGYSSRPGATDISEEIEKERVVNGIKFVLKHIPEAYISVDTFRASVAEAALSEGACMVNDISGGNLDEHMFGLIARWNVPYVLMHMRGTPQTMVKQTHYDNLLLDIISDLQKKIKRLNELGVKDIIVDPGLGFSKNIQQNFFILRNLSYFKVLEKPLMVGVSRKSMIYKTLGSDPENALTGTIVLNTISLLNGASIIRVHDVKEAVESVKLYKAVYN